MSRCLPFSPESLSKRRSSHEALIKLQKEKEEINTLRKREDLKRYTKKHGDDKSEKKHKRLSKQYAQMAMSDDSISGKSDVTEEFRPPTYSTRIGIENPITNKRKREEESPDGVESKRIILRFRLPLKKHSAPDATLTESAKNLSAEKSVVVEEAEQPIKKPFTKRPEKRFEEKPSTERFEKNKNVQVDAEKPFTKCSEKIKNVRVEEAEKPVTKRLGKNAEEAEQPSKVDAKKHKSSRRSKRSSMHKMLIEDWVPPIIDQLTKQQIACEDDDSDDWLFGSRKKQEHEKQDQEYCLSSGLWPQATHFPEVDIYALPYTILF